MSADIPYIGPRLVYAAEEDNSEREFLIESLLFILQEVRAGNIDSVCFAASSECGERVIMNCIGVRDDMHPSMIGLMEILKSDMMRAYEEAIRSGNSDHLEGLDP